MPNTDESNINWDRWRAALAWHLESTGESRKNFATRAGVPASTLYGWLSKDNKHHKLGLEHVRKIELAIGSNLDHLSQAYEAYLRNRANQGQGSQEVSVVAFEQSTEQRVRLLADVMFHILEKVSPDRDYIEQAKEKFRQLDVDTSTGDTDAGPATPGKGKTPHPSEKS